jgi:AcrR family transcriptional regulator
MTDERTTTRRERRIAARRAQILEAAATVFSEKGYERATTREIADAADVSEGTLYNYFRSKRDLLLGLSQEFADETVKVIMDVQVESVEEMMAQILANRLRHIQQRHHVFILVLHQARLDPEVHRYYVEEALYRIRHEIEQRLRALIAAGVLRPVNPAIATRTIMGAMMGFAIQLELGGDSVLESMSAESLAAEVTDIFLNGLLAQPADETGGAP